MQYWRLSTALASGRPGIAFELHAPTELYDKDDDDDGVVDDDDNRSREQRYTMTQPTHQCL